MIWTSARTTVCDAELSEVGEFLASRLRKPVPERPSVWVARNITLTREMSPAKPGPMDPDFKPWTADVLDWRWVHPGRKGLVIIKRAQIGLTTAVMALVIKRAAELGGPMLYINGDKESSLYWSKEFLDPVLKGNPALAALFDEAVDLEDRRETGICRPFRGGRLDFAGGGSVAGVTGRPYVELVGDEIDVIEDNFPAKAGSPWGFLKSRTLAVEHQAFVTVFSHPRTSKGGVSKIFRDECNRHAWCFDCPHPECGQTIAPKWAMVRFVTPAAGGGGGGGGGMGAFELAAATLTGELQDGPQGLGIDASMARMHCPHCDRAIPEADRRRAVWPARLGGTGRFVHDGGPSDREYDGLEIHGLCDPHRSLSSLAAGWLACRTEIDRRTFLNLECGEVDEDRNTTVTADRVKQALRDSGGERYLLPPPPLGVFPHLVVAGIDVQFPPDNPTFYATAQAYTGSGSELVLDMIKLSGWAALFEWLATASFSFDASTGWAEGITRVSRVGIMGAGIDCGWETSQVLDNCRREVVSRVTGGIVDLLPLRFQAHIKAPVPAVMPSPSKMTDPARPHLGQLQRFDLHRDTWVGRSMRRWNEAGRRVVVCRPPPDLAAHATANVLVPAPDEHGWGNTAMVWERIKLRRDDWQMALTYGEVYASLRCGLDDVHELVTRLRAERPASGGRAGGGAGGGLYDGMRTDHWF